MMWVFEGIELGKWTKRKTFANRTPSSHFRRFNLSLVSCSPAELISVSIERSKFQFNQLYLQTVEKVNHLPGFSCFFCWFFSLCGFFGFSCGWFFGFAFLWFVSACFGWFFGCCRRWLCFGC